MRWAEDTRQKGWHGEGLGKPALPAHPSSGRRNHSRAGLTSVWPEGALTAGQGTAGGHSEAHLPAQAADTEGLTWARPLGPVSCSWCPAFLLGPAPPCPCKHSGETLAASGSPPSRRLGCLAGFFPGPLRTQTSACKRCSCVHPPDTHGAPRAQLRAPPCLPAGLGLSLPYFPAERLAGPGGRRDSVPGYVH